MIFAFFEVGKNNKNRRYGLFRHLNKSVQSTKET